MRKLILFTSCIALMSACSGSTSSDSTATKSQAKKDCAEAFSDGHTADSTSTWVTPNTPNEDVTNVTDAINAIKQVASIKGCDATTLNFKTDPAISNCSDLTPSGSMSFICYIETEQPGFFFVTNTFPDGARVTYSRWD